ncbi:MAG: DUF2167 domain-containing protein [bacterium]
MTIRAAAVLGAMCIFAIATNGQTQAPNPVEKVKWQPGPSVGDLNGLAEIRVPAGFVFAGAEDTQVLMEAMHNPVSRQEMGFVAPEGLEWFVVFEYEDVGYVRDDEKGSLDAAAMLESIKNGTEASNKERQRRGWATMNILGWEQAPRYNETTHNLEWAIKAESEGQQIVNYNTRLLGRGGVMRVTLVADPATYSLTLPKFKDVLAGYDFKQGKKYAEWREGDKIAKYGLSALVVGGAAAVAAKAGLFKWLWKILVVGAIAIAGMARSVYSRLTSRRRSPESKQ